MLRPYPYAEVISGYTAFLLGGALGRTGCCNVRTLYEQLE